MNGATVFFVGEIVKPSGKGRTATWEGMVGTVVCLSDDVFSIFVRTMRACSTRPRMAQWSPSKGTIPEPNRRVLHD